jgi:hypothetical protein
MLWLTMRDELALSYMDERGGQIKDNMVSLKMVLKGEEKLRN